MTDDRTYQKLKDKATKATAARDRAAGQLEATMERLREEYGCEDLRAAKTKLKALRAEATEAEEALTAAMEDFEEAWDDQLED